MSGGTTHAASAPEPPLVSKTNEEEDGEGEDTKVPLDLIIQVKWLISFSHSTFQAEMFCSDTPNIFYTFSQSFTLSKSV